MLRIVTALAALALCSCETESTQVVSNGAVVEAAPVALQVHAQPGPAPNLAIVRAVTPWGVSVGPDSSEISVDGSPTAITLGPQGYAELSLDAELTQVQDTEVISLASSARLPALPRVEAVRPAIAELVAGRRGHLAQSGSQIWWTGPRLPDHPVADLGSPIRGLRAGQFDGDGVVDAIAWGGERVLLLRGRADGGAGFGAAFEAPGWTVLAAAAGDLDEDGDVDVAIAWDTGSGTALQAWASDGSWSFEPLDEAPLVDGPIDMDISRARSDGSVVLTALIADAPWVRYRLTDGAWIGTGGQVSIAPTLGSRLLHADFNGDDRDELIIVAPRREGALRDIDVWDLGADNPSLLPLQVQGGHISLGDADADGTTELWTLNEDGLLQVLYSAQGQFERQDAASLSSVGPIGVSQVDDDTVPDLVVGQPDGWQHFMGTLDEDRWRPVRPIVTRRAFELVSDVVGYGTASPRDSLAAIATAGEWMALRRLALDETGPELLPDVRLRPDTVEVVDLAACEDQVWILLVDEVIHVDAASGQVVGRSALEAGTDIACDPGSADTAAVRAADSSIVLSAGAVQGTVSASTAPGITFVDGSVVDCASTCVTWPLPDGGDVLVEATEDQTLVHLQAGPAELPGGGHLIVQDSNGDGVHELWSRDGSGRIRVVQASAAGPVTTAWLWSSPRYTGAPLVAPSQASALSVWFADGADVVWMP